MGRAEKAKKNSRPPKKKRTLPLQKFDNAFPKDVIFDDTDGWEVSKTGDDPYSEMINEYFHYCYPEDFLSSPVRFHQAALFAMVAWNLAVAEKLGAPAEWGRQPYENMLSHIRKWGLKIGRKSILDLVKFRNENEKYREQVFLVRNYDVVAKLRGLIIVVAAEEPAAGTASPEPDDSADAGS